MAYSSVLENLRLPNLRAVQLVNVHCSRSCALKFLLNHPKIEELWVDAVFGDVVTFHDYERSTSENTQPILSHLRRLRAPLVWLEHIFSPFSEDTKLPPVEDLHRLVLWRNFRILALSYLTRLPDLRVLCIRCRKLKVADDLRDISKVSPQLERIELTIGPGNMVFKNAREIGVSDHNIVSESTCFLL